MASVKCFYHYTSTAGANAIRDDGILRSHTGVKLSTLKPEENNRNDILRNIFGNRIPTESQNRADNVVVVTGSILDASKLSEITPTLYQYSGEIRVSADAIKDKPPCVNGGSSSRSGQSSSSESQKYSQTLYYYTNRSNAASIMHSGVIPCNCTIYLTKMQPEHYFRDEILKTIYGKDYDRLQYGSFADWCIQIDGTKVDTRYLKQNGKVYEYADSIRIDASDVMDKPQCIKAGSQKYSQTLYYYTNRSNAASIMHSGVIPYNCTIFLTKMTPEHYFRDEILITIYGKDYDRLQYGSFADWCIQIDGTKVDARYLKQNGKVYEYADSIRIDPSDVMDKPQCIKGGQRSRDAHDYLYHYTNAAGAQAIKTCGYLKESRSSGAFGVGVYMTNLMPTDFFRDEILKNNYGGINSAFKGRADWVVRVKKSNLVNSKLKAITSAVTKDESRRIFVYGDVVNVNSSDVYIKPKCYRAE